MKSKVALNLAIIRYRKYLISILLFFILLHITGCVEQTVKIIVIPARAGGGGLIGLFFLAALISAVFDRPKKITPEQAQQIDSQIHESSQLMPAVSSKVNYAMASGILAPSIAFVESETLSPHLNFKVFSQPLNNNSSGWQQQELVDVTVDSSTKRRLLFRLQNNIEGQKILITWDLPHEASRHISNNEDNSKAVSEQPDSGSGVAGTEFDSGSRTVVDTSEQWQPSDNCKQILNSCGQECIYIRYINNASMCQGNCAEGVNLTLRNLGLRVEERRWWSMDAASGAPACVGYRPDLGGTIEGAKCLARVLGPEYSVGSCDSDGFPYNVRLK